MKTNVLLVADIVGKLSVLGGILGAVYIVSPLLAAVVVLGYCTHLTADYLIAKEQDDAMSRFMNQMEELTVKSQGGGSC